MELIHITRIDNTLDLEVCTFLNDLGEMMVLSPGDSIDNITNLTLVRHDSLEQITQETLRKFQVEGYICYSMAWVNGVGVVSALGDNPEAYIVEDPELLKITWDALQGGEDVKLHLQGDLLSNGQRVTWVLGDLDDSN